MNAEAGKTATWPMTVLSTWRGRAGTAIQRRRIARSIGVMCMSLRLMLPALLVFAVGHPSNASEGVEWYQKRFYVQVGATRASLGADLGGAGASHSIRPSFGVGVNSGRASGGGMVGVELDVGLGRDEVVAEISGDGWVTTYSIAALMAKGTLAGSRVALDLGLGAGRAAMSTAVYSRGGRQTGESSGGKWAYALSIGLRYAVTNRFLLAIEDKYLARPSGSRAVYVRPVGGGVASRDTVTTWSMVANRLTVQLETRF